MARNNRRQAEKRGGQFPETRTEILRAAADGDWTPFFDEYLAPCWREVVLTCRQRGLSLPDADDLLQELALRLMREGRFQRSIEELLRQRAPNEPFRANLAGRYLKYRELPLRSAQFRTYLKQVVQNVVIESLRRQRRQPRISLDDSGLDLEPWVEQSVSRSLDNRWIGDCVLEAASRLERHSRQARTRGQRRLFDILYRSTVMAESPGAIAHSYCVDRSTIADLLGQARERFLEQLAEVTGVAERDGLKELLRQSPQALCSALQRVRAEANPT